MKKNIAFITLAATFLVILGIMAMPKDSRKPGRDYMPDMRYSRAYEAYQTMDFYQQRGFDTMSARLPVSGTIPRGYIPSDTLIQRDEAFLRSFLLKNEYQGFNQDSAYIKKYEESGTVLRNPYAATPEVLKEGKELYTINCQVCHGEKGEGNGQIVVLPNGQDGPYGAVPPAYATRLPQLNDGKIYFTIAFGKGNMGGYGHVLNPSERWKVVNYIKELAGLNNAQPTQAPSDSMATKMAMK